MRQKPTHNYRDYCVINNGKLYGSVSIPIGNGKHKIRRKRVENKTEARQWALEQLRLAEKKLEAIETDTAALMNEAGIAHLEPLVVPIIKKAFRADIQTQIIILIVKPSN